MSLEVEFITLGDASERIDVPAPTLRHWTDQLEEFDAHYTMRNNRNERIYFASDLKIFSFLRDLKAEYGRRTTTRDLANMLIEKGRQGEFELRSKDDAPMPTSSPSNKTNDLLNQEDIQRLMQSERVKQFIEVIISETQKNMREELVEEVRTSMKDELEHHDKRAEERLQKMEENIKKRAEQTDQFLIQMREEREQREKEEKERRENEANKSWWQRITGK